MTLDSSGQLPPAVNTQNVMHLKPCDGTATQKWQFNETNGQIQSSDGQCLGTVFTWLWNYQVDQFGLGLGLGLGLLGTRL